MPNETIDNLRFACFQVRINSAVTLYFAFAVVGVWQGMSVVKVKQLDSN